MVRKGDVGCGLSVGGEVAVFVDVHDLERVR